MIITTVGTSLFENYLEEYDNILEDYLELKVALEEEWDDHLERIEKIKKILANWAKNNNEASAEIKSLHKIQEELQGKVEANLIATDTILSRLAAEIISDNLNKMPDKFTVSFLPDDDVIEGLQVEDRRKFEKGLVELVNRIYELTDGGYKDNVGLNITGGYKAVIPYLTILGQINNIKLYYIFEKTDELIILPQVPIDINFSMFEKYSHVLKELDEGITEGWDTYKRKNNLQNDFQSCIWEEDGMAELNALGRMFWLKYQTFIYVDIIKGSQYFNDSSGNKAELNKAIMELYHRLMVFINENRLTDEESIVNSIKKLSDQDDLRHGQNPDKDKFIFKSTKQSHIRIVYSISYRNKKLSLKVYDYVRGNFDHSKYIEDFKNKFSAQKKYEFTTISL